MELFKPGESKQACLDSCPTIKQCKEIALSGLASRLMTNAVLRPCGVDFQDEATGEFISEAEYYGVEDMSRETAEMLYEGGRLLEDSAYKLRDLLVATGCDEPLEVSPGVFVCTGNSEIKHAITTTHEDTMCQDKGN